MKRRTQPGVTSTLTDQIGDALAAVDNARAELQRVLAAHPTLGERREAHARVRRAFDEADTLLRQACTLARRHSYHDWSLWRHRLSSLDVVRQIHLFAEQDEPGLLPLGSVRAIDTGMSGPDIGELQHGRSREPGTLPSYGIDLETLLTAPVEGGPPSHPQQQVFGGPRPEQAVADPVDNSQGAPPPQQAA